ncbi:MAG TPA: Na+/H+ antiporter NhaC family protein [Vicinamibacteria bacterium]|nr:Na+/H+ antiporter NhaC family protein [Vicinamibacteria bacterium]
MVHSPLRFYGGTLGVVAPFALLLTGVAWLGLSGAPDERGFWPVSVAALGLGLLLSRDRSRFSEEAVRGMGRPIVAVMILSWLLAGVLGKVLAESGFVQALVWLASESGLRGSGYVAASFLVCCIVSTATGTSLGTILVCGPLIYPTGGALDAEPAVLLGAILGGATFGDNLSPISDTTIASAFTQEADVAGVVRSRMKYALIAAAMALVAYALFGGTSIPSGARPPIEAKSAGLVMLIVPAGVLLLLLRGRHLLEGLFFGIALAILLGVTFELFEPSRLLTIDATSFRASGIVLEGMERGIGASIFTLLLMGLVGPLEASGLMDEVVAYAGKKVRSPRSAESWIVAVTSAAALVTTHSTVALLTVGDFARRAGARFDISRYRRANLMDMTVCIWPFLFPYMIPVILAASTSASGEDFGLPRISTVEAGFLNFHAWSLLIVLAVAVITGFGRENSPKHGALVRRR